jgi:CRISPR-associated protein Csd1
MILQALHSYYLRKMQEPDPARRLAAFGLEDKEVPFILELATDGTLVAIKDTRTQDGKKKVAGRYLVPQGIKKTSGVAANLLWDTAEYVLGLDTKGKPERVQQQQEAFHGKVKDLAQLAPDDVSLKAVLAFLAQDPLKAASAHPEWPEIAEANPILSFRLTTDVELVCQRPALSAAVALSCAPAEDDSIEARAVMPCLVTGEVTAVERLHSAIKGVWGAQTSGANIVSFNLPAFNSYGKTQGTNAPVSSQAAFAYTTALNHLLGKGSRQRMQVADTSTVFWAQKPQDEDVEDLFAELFGAGGGTSDDPDAHTEKVRALYESVKAGSLDGTRGQHCFYVLGLAPNAARLAVRFWHAATLTELGRCFNTWFTDLSMVRRDHEPEFPSLFSLLRSVSVLGKADNIPPNLAGDIMRSILDGSPFPSTWLNAAVMRCRAEQDVGYYRAAVIKACLNRQARTTSSSSPHQTTQEAFSSMLNPDHPSTGYQLGRLFATLEKIQEEAQPGINATIRDRFFGAASSSPVTVFPTLIRLKQHHLRKLDSIHRAQYFEQLIGQIHDRLADFPAHMNMAEQGRFALGYYQQRRVFFAKSTPSTTSTQEIAA